MSTVSPPAAMIVPTNCSANLPDRHNGPQLFLIYFMGLNHPHIKFYESPHFPF